MDTLTLRPHGSQRIYDVVEAVGIDVTPWHAGGGYYATNPNFCFRWAFAGNGVAVFCLWRRNFRVIDDHWVYTGNAREEQMARARVGEAHWDKAVRLRTQLWSRGSFIMDETLKDAKRGLLEIRVCVVDTDQQADELEASTADYRGLDPFLWSLQYDMLSGAYEIRRPLNGVIPPPRPKPGIKTSDKPLPLPPITANSYGVGVVDQFIQDDDSSEATASQRKSVDRSAFVRQLVMLRSGGVCEWCSEPGFTKHDGQIYLESHHIVPLSEKGDDTIYNVIALCPNDHRRAHYGAYRDDLAIEMLIRVEERIASFKPGA